VSYPAHAYVISRKPAGFHAKAIVVASLMILSWLASAIVMVAYLSEWLFPMAPSTDSASCQNTSNIAYYYGIVFLAGSAIMLIELLGTRLVAPFYGSSLYVWTSLIAVTMLALAVGYFLGGRLADRATLREIPLLLFLSGVLTAWLPHQTPWVLEATNGLGIRYGALVSAVALFLPVLTVLGMVGPLVIRHATEKLAQVGTRAGTLYAVSTLGGVASTLFLCFFLFPQISSVQILNGLGVTLILFGLISVSPHFWRKRERDLAWRVMTSLVAMGMVMIAILLPEPKYEHPDIRVVSARESLYGWVRVLDFPEKDIRILTTDASVIGAETHSSGETRLTYQLIADVMPSLRPGTNRALLIGQGAGHIAMALERLYGIQTDTIEIDPAVADAAKTYFGFKPNGVSRVGDARYEVSKMTGPYDLIIHDCFTGGSDPTHLLTVEFFQRLKKILRPGGILAINTVGFYEDGGNPAIASVGKTLEAVFSHRRSFIAMPGEDFNDFVMVGSDEPITLDIPGVPQGVRGFLEQRVVEVDTSRGVLLTDDFNPYEHLQLRKSEKYRQLVTEWIGLKLMLR
jgi:spermidine synthase